MYTLAHIREQIINIENWISNLPKDSDEDYYDVASLNIELTKLKIKYNEEYRNTEE
jgi:hypothetical protein